ncbi:MAG: argininosuccinate lyase [Phycisphaerales bacterium]|nr:argininosuccinate lyase [Phycisphaerales bacterium]
MSAVLWANKPALNDAVMEFLAGEDARLDAVLLPYDLLGTRAHVRALALRELLPADDTQALTKAIDALLEQARAGRLAIPTGTEDGHTAIELALTERLGELGKRVHLGRSRNDQVLTALRLYMLDMLRKLAVRSRSAGRTALELASRFELTPMPGYTHMQRAVPSTIGLWMASFAEAFADDADCCDLTINWLNSCPLGTAAGYGVNLPLARDEAARELRFGRVQINPMYAQASRGKFELQALTAAWQIAQTMRRLAWDIVLFSTAEFGFVACDSALTTGSSIMPNKRNPDVAELLRTCAPALAGAMNEIQQIIALPSGYHRDLQATKPPLMRGLQTATAAIGLVPQLLASLHFDEGRMLAAIDGPMFATDRAVELACQGVPFRDAHHAVHAQLDQLENADPVQSIAARTSPGACADLRLDELRERLSK